MAEVFDAAHVVSSGIFSNEKLPDSLRKCRLPTKASMIAKAIARAHQGAGRDWSIFGLPGFEFCDLLLQETVMRQVPRPHRSEQLLR
jgi:hypothetical protein